MKYTGKIFLVIGAAGLAITVLAKLLEVYLLDVSALLWPYAFVWIIVLAIGLILIYGSKR
jgi:hypothetical protein